MINTNNPAYWTIRCQTRKQARLKALETDLLTFGALACLALFLSIIARLSGAI
jgi:hypothetical protein